MSKQWTPDEVLELVRGFQPACVIVAGAELDVFSILHAEPADAASLARRIGGEPRATAILLDGLAALGLLVKTGGRYEVPASVAEILAETGGHCALGMTRHMGNCLRRWGQLARVARTGQPADRTPSVRGPEGDLVSFIRAMHEVSEPVADGLIESLGPLGFCHLLDLGGASGTWAIPLLRRHQRAKATIFDRPEVIPMAQDLMAKVGLADRVRLVAGDFYTDPLPGNADLAWVSAIVHQNSRQQNRDLFAKVFAALVRGGQILIRDIVMDESRTSPAMGALFAVNMLVNTPAGGTFTFEELADDLAAAGFVDARFLRRGQAMDSVIAATKPAH